MSTCDHEQWKHEYEVVENGVCPFDQAQRISELEAQCAAMREALGLFQSTAMGATNRVRKAYEEALAPDAGKALLEELAGWRENNKEWVAQTEELEARLEKADSAFKALMMLLADPHMQEGVTEQERLGVLMRGIRGKANPVEAKELLNWRQARAQALEEAASAVMDFSWAEVECDGVGQIAAAIRALKEKP